MYDQLLNSHNQAIYFYMDNERRYVLMNWLKLKGLNWSCPVQFLTCLKLSTHDNFYGALVFDRGGRSDDRAMAT